MTADLNIQQLRLTVDVDVQTINNQVGPLVLSTTRPYRVRRNSQPKIIARQIDLGPKTEDIGYEDRGTLGSLPAEILWLIFERMDVHTFIKMRTVCKSIKVIAESSSVRKTLEYISVAEPKSLSLFMRSKISGFYTMLSLDVFFEKTCSLCYGHGDGIFLPTMTRICLHCSENSERTSCICMTTAINKYSLTESQIIKARIPLIANAIPTGNLKLLPEILVKEHALNIHGSMANIQLAFEQNRRLKMDNYEIHYAGWEAESQHFGYWVRLMESRLGRNFGQWPDHSRTFYFTEKDRLKRKKPKLPRQAFGVSDTVTASREAGTTKYLTRKAKAIDRSTGVGEKFWYCFGCRRNVLPAMYLIIGAGGSPADVRAAQRPYLPSCGDLLQHQATCIHVAAMRQEHQQKLSKAVKDAVDEQIQEISTAMGF